MSQSGSDHESDYEENDSQPEENESQHEESEPESTGPKTQVQFNSKGQPVGSGSTQFVSFIGRMARMHCPPTYADWPIVPETIKKHLWKTVTDKYDLSPDREAGILLKANISWKGWKYRLRKVYDKFETNAARMETLNIPKRTKKEDWEKFIEICSMDEENIKREKGKLSREHMKLPHTSGRHGCTKIEKELIKESPDGIVTRTQLFVATHTSKDGSCPFPAVKPSLDEIKRLVSLDPYLGNKDLDNDDVAKARRSPHVSPFTRCLLKNFRKRTVALGSVSSDVISTDSYSITIDDIFDCTAELYVREGTLADISIGDTITWPKTFVESI
ncbi:hypothetical protein IFM89_036308 [Coptis chinensis]|uniref:Transposase n=1 Tax=Coptis chinensis TaxID=261450 RepID=A0A835IJ75_9MAGN|nr:hypothetical protein IFM89_036308 [Coptis chinensis]